VCGLDPCFVLFFIFNFFSHFVWIAYFSMCLVHASFVGFTSHTFFLQLWECFFSEWCYKHVNAAIKKEANLFFIKASLFEWYKFFQEFKLLYTNHLFNLEFGFKSIYIYIVVQEFFKIIFHFLKIELPIFVNSQTVYIHYYVCLKKKSN